MLSLCWTSGHWRPGLVIMLSTYTAAAAAALSIRHRLRHHASPSRIWSSRMSWAVEHYGAKYRLRDVLILHCHVVSNKLSCRSFAQNLRDDPNYFKDVLTHKKNHRSCSIVELTTVEKLKGVYGFWRNPLQRLANVRREGFFQPLEGESSYNLEPKFWDCRLADLRFDFLSNCQPNVFFRPRMSQNRRPGLYCRSLQRHQIS